MGNPLGVGGSDHADVGADKENSKGVVSEGEWEEFLQGIQLLQLKLQFEEIYGPEPQIKKVGIFYLGGRKFNDWKRKLLIFIEGAEAGYLNAEILTKNSGWLTPEAQKMFERSAQKRRK